MSINSGTNCDKTTNRENSDFYEGYSKNFIICLFVELQIEVFISIALPFTTLCGLCVYRRR